MNRESDFLRSLIRGMRASYARGENAMAFARQQSSEVTGEHENLLAATLIAYDLQAGSYTDLARENPAANRRWCVQLADLIRPVLPQQGLLLEIGVGEATTLSGVLADLGVEHGGAYGFDISWSRVNEGRNWLNERGQLATLFVADLFHIPLADNSIDVVYSSHSLEPNGGREGSALAECLRVARSAVVLVEPLFELASQEAQARMKLHGYVRGLRETAISLGARVRKHQLLEYSPNPLNPSGVLVLSKTLQEAGMRDPGSLWQCPVTGAPLRACPDHYFAPEVGIAYPILKEIPLLRPEHAVVASGIMR